MDPQSTRTHELGRLAESIWRWCWRGAGGSQGPSAGGHRGGSEFEMLRTRFAQMSKKHLLFWLS